MQRLAGVRVCPYCRLVYTKFCIGQRCLTLWAFDDSQSSLRQTRLHLQKKSKQRFRDLLMKLLFKIYRQFLLCMEKPGVKVPKERTLPLAEMVKIFDSCTVKNGDEDHDRAVDTFQFQEVCLKVIYWCDQEQVIEQKHLKLPYGTVITQAKEQPAELTKKEGLQISIELPWGFTLKSNADLMDVFAARVLNLNLDAGLSKKARMTNLRVGAFANNVPKNKKPNN